MKQTINYTIQNLGETLRIKASDYSLHHTKTMDFACCFYFIQEEIKLLLLSINLNTHENIRTYVLHLQHTALSRSIFYYNKIDYSFCFFYLIDEIKEFLSTLSLTEDQTKTLKTWM